jgi:hypothetical protein
MAYRPAGPGDNEIFPQSAFPSGDFSSRNKSGYTGYSGYEQAAAVDLIIDEKTIAVLIDSTILGEPIWFALRDDWRPDPGDMTPVFYASELAALRDKTAEQLRAIFNGKRAFGGGMVRQ